MEACIFSKKDFGQAEDSFKEAIKLDPLNLSARLSLFQALAGQKKFDEAFQGFDELQDAPSNQDIQIRMALALAEQKAIRQGQGKCSIKFFKQACVGSREISIGRVLKEQGKLSEAEAEFVQINRGQPTFLHSRIMLSLMFLKVKDMGKAIRYIDEAIDPKRRTWIFST